MDSHAVTEFLLSAAAAGAAGRLMYLDLASQVPALLAYLILLAALNFGFGVVDQHTPGYFWFYVVSQALDCICSILAVQELLALVFRGYPGIRTAFRWATYIGMTISIGGSLLVTGFFWRGAAQGRSHSHLFYVQLSQRAVLFSLAVVIATIIFVLSKYPLDLRRNTLVSSAFFSVLFLSEAARLLIDSLAPKLYNHAVDRAESIFITLCLVSWAALLRPEESTLPVQARVPTEHEEYLLKQLESLNVLMSRAGRM